VSRSTHLFQQLLRHLHELLGGAHRTGSWCCCSPAPAPAAIRAAGEGSCWRAELPPLGDPGPEAGKPPGAGACPGVSPSAAMATTAPLGVARALGLPCAAASGRAKLLLGQGL